MTIVNYSDRLLEPCTALWWRLYGDRPYVMRPDGYQAVRTARIGPEYFGFYLSKGMGTDRWGGEVLPEHTMVAEKAGAVLGVLICSVDREHRVGNILVAFTERDQAGREVAEQLVREALGRFRKLKLRTAKVGLSSALEVECPIHLAVLEAGFSWPDNWERAQDGADTAFVRAYPGYLVHLGGPLEGFELSAGVREAIASLGEQGVEFEVLSVDELGERRRADTQKVPDNLNPRGSIPSHAALVDGWLVGWIGHIGVPREDSGLAARACGLRVIPSYRRRGIGKVLYHLGVQAMVEHGAEYGYECAGVFSPSRLVLRSVGYRYWYTSFMPMTRSLTTA